jgi:hypothetical protein
MSVLHSVITQLLRDLKENAPPDADFEMTVVLDLILSSVGADKRPTFGYYFASHIHKRVFWLEDFNLACLSEECDGSMESSSKCKLKFMFKHSYESLSFRRRSTVLVGNRQLVKWLSSVTSNRKHCELFPNTLDISEIVIRELKGILVQASAGIYVTWCQILSMTTWNRSRDFKILDIALYCGKSFNHVRTCE